MPEAEYNYRFAIWPIDEAEFDHHIRELFQLLGNHAVEMVFTAEQFEKFRFRLRMEGFDLRGIKRKRYQRPKP
jgi:hypothetical protein